MRNVNLMYFFIYFKILLLCQVETLTTTKKENSQIQVLEINFFIAIFHKTKEDMIEYINKRL